MDKLRSKQLFAYGGIPTPEFLELKPGMEAPAVLERLGAPLAVKPNRQGSSVGVSKVFAPDGFEAAWAEALRFDDCVLAERWVSGREITASVLDSEVLPLIQIETRTSFTTTTPSITPTARAITVRRSCRRRRPRRLRRLAHAAFELLGGRGWGRVDFMVDHAAIPMCWRSIPCRA